MGLTGLEPVTPRLSSACSNQLSYRPVGLPAEASHLSPQPDFAKAMSGNLLAEVGGGNRNRTDDILLAKQALYQLSYTPKITYRLDQD